jgi:hypothetical protein
MLAVAVGLAVGLAVAFGPLSWLRSVGDGVSSGLVGTVDAVVLRLLAAIPGAGDHPAAVDAFAATLAVAAPGVAAMLMAWGAVALLSAGRRRGVATVFALVGVAGFFALPFTSALLLALFCAAAAALAVSPVRLPTAAGAVALATLLAVQTGQLVVSGEFAAGDTAQLAYVAVSGLAAPEFWAVVVAALAAVPFAAAALVLLRGLGLAGDADVTDEPAAW